MTKMPKTKFTVEKLIKELQNFNNKMEVYASSDEEGNIYFSNFMLEINLLGTDEDEKERLVIYPTIMVEEDD